MRDARGVRALERLAQDVHYALRSLRRAPAFTVIAVLILALGIGTSTAIFAAFDAVMLEDLPATDADRVVALAAQRSSGTTLAVMPDELDALGRASQTLRDVAGVGTSAISMPSYDGDRPLDLDFTWVTANFFDVLGARPVLGRLLRPEDGAEGAPPVAVISYQTWQREFGGDPDVLSRRLTRTQSVSYGPYSIVGVAPPGLDYPLGVDYWIPIGGRRLNMDVVARLKSDVTPEIARSEFLAIVQVVDRERTIPGSPTAATIRPLTDAVLGDARPIAIAITVAVALLLLIACVNVGSLLLMRAARRFGDVIVRRALGATSGEIARLFFVESAVLGTAGGILGFVLALGLLRIIPAWAPAALPRTEMIRLAGSPAVVAIAVTVLSALVFGVVPSLVTARGDLASALRAEGRSGSGSRGRRRVRRSLVAAQVALAAVMLVGAGLLLRTLQRLERLELGYETDGVAIVELSIDREGLDGGFAE
ncbi:MAG: ABC transporter permease, partial [Longimicrobiales bacterium]